MGCPLVVHYRADLQLVHGFRCYNNIVMNAKCPPVLVLALCLVLLVLTQKDLDLVITFHDINE